MTLPVEIMLLVICFIGSAFFSGMETGVISIHRLRLRHLVREGVRGAKTLQAFLANPDHLLGTTLVGTNICNVICSVVTTSICVRFMGSRGYAVASVLTTIVLLIGGEYLPKAWFQAAPSRRTRPYAGILKFFGYAFYPISRCATWMANIMIPAPEGMDDDASSFMITKEELAYLAREGERAGELTESESRMIHGVFELTHRTCGEIMTPREKIVFVQHDTSAEHALNVSRESGVSRLPIYKQDAERFIGTLHIIDILRDTEREGKVAYDYIRPPQFVPAGARVETLLPRMRLSRQPMLLVADSASNVVGIVTTQDVLAEITGQIT